ncbi:hypothetical protein ACA910_014064 [Epithemia clementina (nom. ined.)]
MSRHYEDAFHLAICMNPLMTLGKVPELENIHHLFRDDPQAAEYVDFQGMTFVHLCARYHPSRLDLLQCFINAYPGALLVPDIYGSLPLNLLLRAIVFYDHNRRSFLANENDSNNNNQNDANNSDSELAFEQQVVASVRYLVEKAPEALLHEDEDAQLPLHLVCSSDPVKNSSSRNKVRGNLAIIRSLTEGFPDALYQTDKNGKFPFCHALERDSFGEMAPKSVIEFLIDQAPSVLRETVPDAQGRLPLHRTVAAASFSNSQSLDSNGIATIELLADRFPRALLLQDASYATPLLDACLKYCPLNVIYSLVRQWPEQVTSHKCHLVFENSQFNGELLPLALASEAITLDRVRQWVGGGGGGDKEYKNKSTCRVLAQPDGTLQRLPLHFAVVSRSPDALAIVKYLLKVYPKAASVPDAKNRLPLHYAALALGTHLDDEDDDDNKMNDIQTTTAVDLLVKSHPAGMTAMDQDGLLPWHYASCCQAIYGTQTAITVAERLYDDTVSYAERHNLDLYVDSYHVPDEVRWDIIQVSQSTIIRK